MNFIGYPPWDTENPTSEVWTINPGDEFGDSAKTMGICWDKMWHKQQDHT
jgi:hypothetical protein